MYVEILDPKTPPNLNILRKYMYIHGGYSIYCQDACNDTWRYEISYGPQWMYPKSKSSNTWNRGNQWELVNDGSGVSPGNRFKHTMVVDQNNTYIYLFGGITITNGVINFSNDLWRLNIITGLWEKKSPLGIQTVTRTVTLWDGTNVSYSIDPSQRNV